MASSKKFLTVSDVSKKIGLSRMQVIRKIRSGEIHAERVGRSYIIPEEGLPGIYRKISQVERDHVTEAVRRVLKEYGDVIRRLGREG